MPEPRIPTRSVPTRAAARAGLLVLPALLGLAGLALALECAHRLHRYGSLAAPIETFVRDSAFAYRYNPRSEGYADGFRGGLPPAAKPAGTRRILCVGESITAGDFIPREEDTWPEVLERRLAAASPGIRVEVYNAAIGGHGTGHTVALLRDRLDDYAPDLVIVYAGSVGNGLERGALWVPFPVAGAADTRLMRLDKFLFRHCTLYRVRVRGRIAGFLARMGPPERGELWEAFPGVPEDIGAAVDLVRAAGARPLVIQYPLWRHQGVRNRGARLMDSVAALQDRIGAAAAARGARVLDMRGTLPGGDEARNPYFIDWRHLNREGCRRFGEALADSLLALDRLR